MKGGGKAVERSRKRTISCEHACGSRTSATSLSHGGAVIALDDGASAPHKACVAGNSGTPPRVMVVQPFAGRADRSTCWRASDRLDADHLLPPPPLRQVAATGAWLRPGRCIAAWSWCGSGRGGRPAAPAGSARHRHRCRGIATGRARRAQAADGSGAAHTRKSRAGRIRHHYAMACVPLAR